MRTKLILGLIFLLCAVGHPASAQLTFNLNPAGLTGTPGSSVTFNATLTNIGSDTIWLNGDASTVSVPGLSIDDTPYLNNFPLSLVGGDSATADLFTVAIDPSVAPGDYFGSFAIVGGVDANAQDTLATQNFEVTVSPSDVPEPGVLSLLFGLSLSASALMMRRLRHR